jgi:hypothetical protein
MASRNISISLPEEMIQQATHLAAKEQRTLSELFREAFRVYRAQAVQNALRSQPPGFKEQELTRIAKELRAELEADLSSGQ